MVVCDRCKDVGRPAAEYKVVLAKVASGQARATRTEVDSTSVELCDGCVRPFWELLARTQPVGPAPEGAEQ